MSDQPQQPRILPKDRVTSKVHVELLTRDPGSDTDAEVPGKLLYEFQTVAGFQQDETSTILGNQENRPIAVFATRLVKAIVFENNDVLASTLVTPTFAPGPRLVQ